MVRILVFSTPIDDPYDDQNYFLIPCLCLFMTSMYPSVCLIILSFGLNGISLGLVFSFLQMFL